MSQESPAWRPWVVLVGGFLGAGKTSLILTAARILEERGVRCAAVLNDQGDELVDTNHAGLRGVVSREVTGGCFCCRFSELLSATEALRTYAPEVIFAEPVGSCTDIVATVLRPLLEEFEFCRVAPLTVLVDPARTTTLLTGDADANLVFLLRKQLEEADVVCMSKADLYPNAAGIPGTESRRLSSKTGLGVAEWLDEVLGGCLQAGAKALNIDYEEYARAEAALAWLNLSLTFEPAYPASPASVTGPLLDSIDEAMTVAGVSFVHLKLIDRSPAGWVKAATCGNGQEPVVEGALDASPASRHELLLNLRAIGSPLEVQTIVEKQIESLEGRVLDVRLDCFSPAPPKPERRVAKTQL
jgi:hypothetical protein